MKMENENRGRRNNEITLLSWPLTITQPGSHFRDYFKENIRVTITK